MRIIRRSRTAIGVDIGTRTIKAAQLCRSNGQYRIVALALFPRVKLAEQIDTQEILSLRDFLRRQGFCGNDVVLAVPDEKLLRGIIELPSRVSGDAVGQMARMELSRLYHVAPDSFELVYWELASADKAAFRLTDKSKPTTQTLAFGCPHDVANAYLAAFEEAGLNVMALDVRSAAAVRACLSLTTSPESSCRKTEAGLTCLLDLEWNSTKLLLVLGQTLIYEKFVGCARVPAFGGVPPHSKSAGRLTAGEMVGTVHPTSMARLSARLSKKFSLPQSLAYQIIRAVGLPSPQSRGQGGTAGTDCDSNSPTTASAFAATSSELDQKSVEAIRKILMNHFDTVAEELKTPLAYASQQYPDKEIEQILLIGDGARILGISQYLADILGIEVSPAAPSELLDTRYSLLDSRRESRIENQSIAGNPDLTVAVGLAKFAGGG